MSKKELTKEEQLQKDLTELRKEHRSVSGKLERRDNRVEILTEENKKLKEDFDRIEKESKDKDKEVKDLKKELKELEKQIKNLEKDLEKEVEKIKQFRDSEKTLKTEITGLEKEDKKKTEDISKLKKEIDKTIKEKENSEKEYEKKIKELEKQTKEIKGKEKDLLSAEKESNKLKDKLKKLEKENKDLLKNIEQLEAAQKDISKSKKDLENKNKSLEDEIKELNGAKKELTDKDKRIQEVIKQVDTLKSENTDLKRELEEIKIKHQPKKIELGNQPTYGVLTTDKEDLLGVISDYNSYIAQGFLPEEITSIEFEDEQLVLQLGDEKVDITLEDKTNLLEAIDNYIYREHGIDSNLKVAVPLELNLNLSEEKIRRNVRIVIEQLAKYNGEMAVILKPILKPDFFLFTGKTEVEVMVEELEGLKDIGNISLAIVFDEENIKEYNKIFENNPYTIEELSKPVIKYNESI